MSNHGRLLAGREARNVAVNELIIRHQEEYNELLAKARVDRGLPAESSANRKPPSRLEILREQLRSAGIEPDI